MARTRSAKGAAGAGTEAKPAKSKGGGKEESSTNTTATYTLPEETQTPPRVFILPKKATSEARIVTLQNPRYPKPTRYLVCPETGFFEFTKIAAPSKTPRSWLIQGKEGEKLETQVTKSADLYIASPIDPLFLILPALVGDNASSTENKKRMFLSSDDYFDFISEIHDSIDERNHLSEILSWPKTRCLLETRMAAACDTVEAGDEQMFRLNESKLLGEILSKAKRMAEHGLPRSMEDKFVTKALDAPILSVRSTAGVVAPSSESQSTNSGSGGNTPSLESSDSQSTISSVETAATAASEASTAATSVSDQEENEATKNGGNEVLTNAITAPREVLALQKIRVSFDFICSSYLPPALSKVLKDQLSLSKMSSASAKTGLVRVDFTPLEEYLSKLTKLRQEAAAARATTDYSRNKRTRDEEDDERAEKKRKKEEAEKAKKVGMSRGVRELSKVNTKGMKKMSEFFKKK